MPECFLVSLLFENLHKLSLKCLLLLFVIIVTRGGVEYRITQFSRSSLLWNQTQRMRNYYDLGRVYRSSTIVIACFGPWKGCVCDECWEYERVRV